MPPSPLVGRRVVLFGASGFLGRWVARELLARGAEALGVVRAPGRVPADLSEALEFVTLDLARPGGAAALVRRVRPALVLNLAGYGVAKDERDEGLAERLNHALVEELLEALAATPGEGVRLLQLGSALEAGPTPASLDEQAACAPTEAYGRTKLAATHALAAARARGLAVLAARAFTVFGPGERPGRLVPALLAARGGSAPIPLSSGHQQRDFVYVEDAARAILDLAELEPARVLAGAHPFDAPTLNLASGRLTRVRDFVRSCAQAFGLDPARLAFGALPGLPEEMHHPAVPVTRLGAALGWTPPAEPSSGLARLVARLRQDLT